MRIEIEIPKEFEEHFEQDKFEDTLHRLSADAHLIAGNYEQETAIMLIKAFKESKPAYDTEKVIAELERKKEQCEKDSSYWADRSAVDSCIYNECDLFGSKADLLEETIEIVRKGGAENSKV